jgi:MFS family permease
MTIRGTGERNGPIASSAGANRAFTLILAGSSVSMLGSRVTAIAYPMLILYLTRSPVDAGWAAFAATAPSILVYLPAGALIDRRDPRRVMLWSEIGRGLAIAAIVCMVAWWRSVPLLILAAVVEESLEVFSTLAERRCVASLVERSRVPSALVRVEGRTHVVVMMGRPLGGLLFELGPIIPFLIDILTFIFSVCALLGIRSERATDEAIFAKLAKEMGRGRLRRVMNRPPGRPEWHVRSDIREGLNWLLEHRFARAAVVLSGTTTLICQGLIMVFIAQANARQMSSIAIGSVLAMSGLGGALGSALASRLRLPATHSLIKLQMLVWCVVFFMLAISGGRSPVCMAASMATLGFMGAMGNIEVATYLVQNANDKIARVTSIGRLTSFAAAAIGPVIGGYFFQQWGVQGAVYLLLMMTTLSAAYSVLTPSMRAAGRLRTDNQEICPRTAQ